MIGVFNYLDAARINKVPRFIFASSGAPAGEVNPPIHEELPPHPASPYGASKLAGEGYCCAYFKSFGIVILAFLIIAFISIAFVMSRMNAIPISTVS